jgi:iron complex transport system ATP-binding protein
VTALLEARGIGHAYGARTILDGINVTFSKGQVVSLLGPNGCGKTTFIKILLGLIAPRAGQIIFEGAPLSRIPPKAYARRVAYVPQVHRTAFPYAVEDVVAMGRLPHQSAWSLRDGNDRERIDDALDKLGIGHLRQRAYTQISGGERQLTLIARALAQGADTFIMDEPTSALDYGHQVRLLEQLVRLADEGFTCITSTHSPEHALWAADRVVLLLGGQIIADGKPAQHIVPATLQRLYGVQVDVAQTNNGQAACVPASLRVRRRGGVQLAEG